MTPAAPPLAQVFARGAARPEVEAALAEVLRRDGYVPFDEARIPPGYPAERGEFDRWLVAGPDDAGTVALVAADVRRAFARARDLSAVLPRVLWVALVRPPAAPLRLKAWRDGALRVKVGDDPDEELFYHPVAADGPAVAAFLGEWGGGSGGPSPAEFLRGLELVRVDRTFLECREGAWPLPASPATFVSRGSRLFVEGD